MFPDPSTRRGLRLDIQKAAPLRKTWTLGELAKVCQARQSLLFHAIAGSGDTTLCTERTGCYVQVAQRKSASHGTLQLRPAAVSELVEEGCYHHRDGAIVLPWDGRVLYHLRGHVVDSAAEGATPLSMDHTVNSVARGREPVGVIRPACPAKRLYPLRARGPVYALPRASLYHTP